MRDSREIWNFNAVWNFNGSPKFMYEISLFIDEKHNPNQVQFFCFLNTLKFKRYAHFSPFAISKRWEGWKTYKRESYKDFVETSAKSSWNMDIS